jgi:zinc transporter ZupT
MDSFLYFGALISFIGSVWFIILAIQTGKSNREKALWAIISLICQPIGGLIFYIVKRVGLVPLILVIIGAILMAVGYTDMASRLVRL